MRGSDQNDLFFPPAPQRDPSDLGAQGFEAPEEADQSSPRRAIRLGMNVLWIVGAVLLTLLQMCRGGA
jgi:hypothetical protein